MSARGVHRIKNPSGKEDGVWVVKDDTGMEMPEAAYLEAGLQPPLELLPWGYPHPPDAQAGHDPNEGKSCGTAPPDSPA